jgi:HSP20 family protein
MEDFMALIRYEANPMSTLLGELDNLWLDDFGRTGRDLVNCTYPNVDILETETGYRITADLPGLSKEDVKVNIENGVLTISGEKKTEVEKRDKNKYYHFERSYGKFTRSFSLPEHVDSAGIDARYNNGILELNIKKNEEAKPKAIEVKVQ